MKSIALTTASPGTFTYEEGQTFYNEKLAYEILKHAAAMADEGCEITFEVLDETSWGIQTSTLMSQDAMISAIASDAKMPTAWSTRLATMGSILTSLLTLPMDTANFSLRATMMTLLENVIASAASQVINPEEQDELVEVLKRAFLKETVPGSGTYTETAIDELKTVAEAINTLAMTENAVQCPHTGHYIYTKSLGTKTL